MFKKDNLSILFFIVIIIFTLVACNEDKDGLVTSTIHQDIEAAKKLSVEDMKTYVDKNVQLSLENISELSLENINVEEDKLLLERKSHRKTFSNMEVDININIDKKLELSKKEEIAETFYKKLLDNLSNDNLELIRLRRIAVRYEDDLLNDKLNHETIYSENNPVIIDSDLEENQELADLNKKIYKTLESNLTSVNKKLKVDIDNVLKEEELEYKIERIGIKNGTFKIESRIFFYNGQEVDYESDLNEISKNIFNFIKEDNKIVQTLKERKVSQIELQYNAKWYKKGESLKFNYEL